MSPDLVAAANDRAQRAGLAQIRFEQGDAATGMPVEAPFDRLFSRFGLMFFPEPYPAFANLRRMLRDGGRLDIATRSEEHTSELQSLMRISYAVFCLKKKTTKT